MKVFQARLEKLLNSVEEKLEEREDYFDERSESWQIGEKGEMYQGKTDLLERFRDELDMSLDTIKEYVDWVF